MNLQQPLRQNQPCETRTFVKSLFPDNLHRFRNFKDTFQTAAETEGKVAYFRHRISNAFVGHHFRNEEESLGIFAVHMTGNAHLWRIGTDNRVEQISGLKIATRSRQRSEDRETSIRATLVSHPSAVDGLCRHAHCGKHQQ